MPGNWHVLFGKGPTEKCRAIGDSPAAYFTREGADGKGLQPGVPRRRPTSLGKGPTEKARGTGTSPAAYFTREGADGKGLQPGVPRRRPTSLGKGPTEKDSSQEYLAGGLLHLMRGG